MGLKQRVCECGEKETEEIAALGHTEVIDNAVAATCTKTGLTEGKHCSVCNEVLVAPEEVAALGHTEVIDNAVAPTCTATGLTEGKHCSVCNDVLVKQETVDTVPHKYEAKVCIYCGEEQRPSEGLLYERNDDGVSFTVAGIGICTDTDLVIPETYKDLPVTSIGKSAFRSCSNLTSIEIPDSVTSIGYMAFCDCSSLTGITIPDSVTNIAWYAFLGCSSLTSITIPDGVTSIGYRAFSECSSLTSVTIPNSVTSIDSLAFSSCSSLTSVTIPDSVTSIGNYAFSGCNLNAVYISDLAAWCNIGFSDNPLRYAGNLYINGKLATDIVIPDSVTSIASDAFWSCSSLTSVTIPDSITFIGSYAFCYCSNLTDFYYDGTYEQWNVIKKDSGWIDNTINYTVHCTDGDFSRYE